MVIRPINHRYLAQEAATFPSLWFKQYQSYGGYGPIPIPGIEAAALI